MAALLKLTLIFIAIIILLNRKWNLGLVLLLASVAVGMLFAHPLVEITRDVLLTAVDLLTLRLALIVVLIMTLGELLRQTASTKGMVEALQELIPNGRIVIAAIPALIGLLPMVGGAMFSAPMVDEVGERLGADSARKTFINYWFRHVWEPILPLYPSLMLGAALMGLTTIQLIGATWPLAVAAVLGGLIFGLMGLPQRGDAPLAPTPRRQSLHTLTTSIWPIMLVIALALSLPIDERLTLITSLLMTITAMMIIKRIPLRDLATILHQRIPWKTVTVIFGALIFRRVLENSGAVLAVSDGLAELHIPLTVLAFGVPFIAGLLTGLMAAGFSIGFPVILPLVVDGTGIIAPGWAAWLMAGGLVGAMLSPIHLCLGLTRVYFKAEWGPIYRFLAPAALLIITAAAGVLLLS